MKSSTISYGFLLPFLIATLALRWRNPSVSVLVFLVALWMVLSAAALLLQRRKRSYAVIPLILFGIVMAWLNVQLHQPMIDSTHVALLADGRTVTLRGVISDEPDRRAMQTKYTIDVSGVVADNMPSIKGILPAVLGSETRNVARASLSPAKGAAFLAAASEQEAKDVTAAHGRMLATDRGQWPEYQYGDEVEMTGTLTTPGTIDDFDYGAYLSIKDIRAVMQPRTITLLRTMGQREQSADPPSVADRLQSGLITLKDGFEMQIDRVYPEPHASLLAGLLTGSRRGIPAHLTTAFQVVGLSHIVAISGYNITIILTLLSGMLFFVPLKWRIVPLTAGIVLFTVLVGASASVVRAAIMGVLGLVALQAGRQRHERLLILWTAFLMVAWNPRALWYDAGFQLSFLAVIGLMELSPWLLKRLQFVPATLAMRESLVATIAAQLATLPLSIILFHRLSLIAPVSNLLVAPLVPLAMLFGFLGTALSFVSFPLGQLIGYVGFGWLHLMILIAQGLAMIPWSAVPL